MAFAVDTYTGNGSTTTFSVTFPYIEQAHVIVTVDGVTKTLTTDYTFPTSSTITFTSAPAASTVIKFTRSSNRTARLVDYQDGSTLTEANLDQDGNQSFFMAQEAIDVTDNALTKNALNLFDANNNRIINVADPTSAQDASTKAYVDSILTTNNTAVANATTQANNAAASASTAAGHVSTALGHANTASGHATTASNQATAAANSATQAANSASQATVTTGLVIAMAIAL
tara:strand:- start:721 stop:1410 length:690 start_codon:yes stop_codon:yes gene_type:complete